MSPPNKTMRIGLDVSALAAPNGGIGTYTRNLWEQMSRRDDTEVVPLAHRPIRDGSTTSADVHRLSMNKTLWMQSMLPWQLQRLGVDLCHFTNNVASVWAPCPTVVTIHDMSLWLYPQHHYLRRTLAMRPVIPLAARRANAIIAVSLSTKRDIVRILGVPEAKVHVVYEAPGPAFRQIPPGPALDAVRRRYHLPDRFFLFVGTIEPRKNLVRLLQALNLLVNSLPQHLVIAGQRGWKDEGVYAEVEALGLGDRVHHLGYVPVDDLVGLYNLADALAFPSLHEGFGLPVVEAMACCTPVVASKSGGLAEVAGDATEVVDPLVVESIAAGLWRMVSERGRRDEMIQRGAIQARRFSWSLSAAETREVYVKALQSRDGA